MDDETAYQAWLAIGQNYELDRFAVTRVAFMAGRASLCETCHGVGTIDERLGGYAFSNPAAECPDCGGKGRRALAGQASTQALAEPDPVEVPAAWLITLQVPGKWTQYASVFPDERRDDVDDAMWASRKVQPLALAVEVPAHHNPEKPCK